VPHGEAPVDVTGRPRRRRALLRAAWSGVVGGGDL